MKEHLCFECAEAIKRTVDTFIETTCRHFPPVKQQVIGNVVQCDKFVEIEEPEE